MILWNESGMNALFLHLRKHEEICYLYCYKDEGREYQEYQELRLSLYPFAWFVDWAGVN